MAVVEAGDIEARYSVKAGSAGDSTASTAAGSLGKYLSTSVIPDGTIGNLIPSISAAQNEAGITLYRCRFITNTGAGTWADVRVWVEAQEVGGADVAIGLDPAGVTDHDSASAQAAEIADQETVPAGVTFSAPTDYADGLQLGSLGPDKCAAVWLRATVQADSAATIDDNIALRSKGTSEV